VNDKLYIILKVIKPVFDLYIKVRRDKKVSDRCQINDGIFKVVEIYSNHLIIKDIVIKDETGLIRYNRLRKRLSKSYTEYKESEK
jgi:hypothetical protein